MQFIDRFFRPSGDIFVYPPLSEILKPPLCRISLTNEVILYSHFRPMFLEEEKNLIKKSLISTIMAGQVKQADNNIKSLQKHLIQIQSVLTNHIHYLLLLHPYSLIANNSFNNSSFTIFYQICNPAFCLNQVFPRKVNPLNLNC